MFSAHFRFYHFLEGSVSVSRSIQICLITDLASSEETFPYCQLRTLFFFANDGSTMQTKQNKKINQQAQVSREDKEECFGAFE